MYRITLFLGNISFVSATVLIFLRDGKSVEALLSFIGSMMCIGFLAILEAIGAQAPDGVKVD